jgi:radical SAM superfamily enzyme YgiQ (UPF0313 family)
MHPTLFASEIIENVPEIDAVSIGESDDSFPNLLRYWYGEASIERLYGVALKTGIRPRQGFIKNLDALPTGYEYFDFGLYKKNTANYWSPDGFRVSDLQMPILTSRSCPNRCNFCSMRLVMGDRCRVRSAENVFNEIRFLYDTYGVNYFRIMDDNFTLYRKRALEICKLLKSSGIKAYFDLANGTSVKAIDEELIAAMREVGFIFISFAIEHGNDFIRNSVMKKRTSKDEIFRACSLAAKYGMNTGCMFIFGMPEETVETSHESMSLLSQLDVDKAALFKAKPLPGTELFEQCKRDNCFSASVNYDALWFGEQDIGLANDTSGTLNYDFHKGIETEAFYIKPYNMSYADMNREYKVFMDLCAAKSKRWLMHISGEQKFEKERVASG